MPPCGFVCVGLPCIGVGFEDSLCLPIGGAGTVYATGPIQNHRFGPQHIGEQHTAPSCPGYLFGFGHKRFCLLKAGLMGKRDPELVEDVGACFPGRRLLQRGPILLFRAGVVAAGKQDIAARHGGLE